MSTEERKSESEGKREGLREVLKGNPPTAGTGDGLIRRESMAMAERAVRNRWAIPDETRAEVVKTALEIVRDPNLRLRDRNAAMRVLASFDALNVARDRLDSDVEEGPSMTLRFDKTDKGGGGIQKIVGAFLREGYTE